MREDRNEQDPGGYQGYSTQDALTVTLTRILDGRAGLGWGTLFHTGIPVITYALGAGADLYKGQYDNTDIAMRIGLVMVKQ